MKMNRIKMILASMAVSFLMTGCAGAVSQGVKALEDGDYAGALSKFQEAAEGTDDGESAEGYRGMGIAYYESGDYAAALEAFKNALDGGAESVFLYNLAGVCAMQTGDYETALGYIQAGLSLSDTDSGKETDAELVREMKYNEIICCEELADWETAKAKISEYLEQYPDDETAQREAEFLKTR